ncbi:MAG: ethylbenzene dehydrogenase-related protein [Pseudomonadota bacterium]
MSSIAPDTHAPSAPTPSAPALSARTSSAFIGSPNAASIEAQSAPPTSKLRSDAGTIALHWLTALSMLLSIVTGLRISADNFAAWASPWLDPILPQGEVWTLHILGSFVLVFCACAYFIYAKRAALLARNGPNRLRTLTPPTTARLRWRAINVALHWFAYAAIATLTVTGVLLYIGQAGLALTVHRALAWAMVVYIFIHTLTHFAYGGVEQLLRLFRPERLSNPAALRRWPMEIAVLIGAVLAGTLWWVDLATRPALIATSIDTAPKLDGRLDEPFWQRAKTTTIDTHQGEGLGGNGTSAVTVRAARTENQIHFAFEWQDPTRSLMRSPAIKREDGWYLMSSRGAIADVVDYYEDKFAVLFTQADPGGALGTSTLGGGRSTFLGDDPLPGFPKSPHRRGLHYTDDGRIMDLWQWKSSRGGMIGHVDDMHFGPPKTATPAQEQGKKRYAAGYASDPGKAIYEYNYIADGPRGYAGPVRLKYLPKDLAKSRAQLGTIPATADGQNDEGSKWWYTKDDIIAYDAKRDAKIPLGTVIPTTLNIHTYQGDRADVAGGARWNDGVWTLEISRTLDTKSGFDVAFQKGQTYLMWVSVFDHNQIRHTRHQRPIELLVE